jgi:hypothetical protein
MSRVETSSVRFFHVFWKPRKKSDGRWVLTPIVRDGMFLPEDFTDFMNKEINRLMESKGVLPSEFQAVITEEDVVREYHGKMVEVTEFKILTISVAQELSEEETRRKFAEIEALNRGDIDEP